MASAAMFIDFAECWTPLLLTKRESLYPCDLFKQTCPFLDSLASLVASSPYPAATEARSRVRAESSV